MKKLLLIFAYIGLIMCSLTLATSTYAYFTVEVEGESEEIIITTFDKTMQIKYVDTSNVSLVNAYTGSTFTKTFTVQNTGETVVYYDLIFDNLVNNFSNPDDLVYTLTSTNNGAVFNEKTMPHSNNIIASNIEIMPGVIQEYQMLITFKKTNKDQSNNMNKTFSANIDVIESKIPSGVNQYKINTLGSIFKKNESKPITNLNYNLLEDGIYYTNDTINGETIYFYRGSKNLNNNLVFNKKCFKILRTTDNHGVRVIYNGELNEDMTCTQNVLKDKTLFNINSNYNAHVGYMYGDPSSTTYEDEHTNTNSSKIKELLDSWYLQNISEKSKYIVDSMYCQNRKLTEMTINKVYYGLNGYGNKNTGYDSLNILNQKATLNCINENDRLSINSKTSSNVLNYGIALITADEAYMAGSTFKNNFLASTYPYWTMTPAYYNGTSAYNYVVKDSKLVYNKTSALNYVRPVITLNADSRIITGDGSTLNPYIIN